MHCYVDVKNKDENLEVVGIADKKEIIKVIIDENGEWIVVQDKSLSGSLDEALKMAELFNDVMIEAKKLRQSKEIQEIDIFKLIHGQKLNNVVINISLMYNIFM